jgi:hypothetical protein
MPFDSCFSYKNIAHYSAILNKSLSESSQADGILTQNNTTQHNTTQHNTKSHSLPAAIPEHISP